MKKPFQYKLTKYSSEPPHEEVSNVNLPLITKLLFVGRRTDTIHLFGNYFIERTTYGFTRDFGLSVICYYLGRSKKKGS